MAAALPGSQPGRDPDVVRLRAVSVTYAGPRGVARPVLDRVDLDVPAGQFLAVVGRNGCGKTTLLNLLAGVVEPTSGSVEVHGTTPRQARPQLGFMLARDALLPWRTALRNVEYGLELRGVDRTTRRHVAREWLARVGLHDVDRLWPWQLSQGMRQRVALARTWALDPDLLLMDEPFAALDAHSRLAIQQQFLDLWQAEVHRTVVMVTHDLREAIALADRVVVLGEGRLLDDVDVDLGRPRDLEEVATHAGFGPLHTRLRTCLQ